MKKKVLSVLMAGVMTSALLIGCGSSAPAAAPAEEAAEEPAAEVVVEETEPVAEEADFAE